VPNLLKVKSISIGPSILKLAYDFLITAAAVWLVITKKYDIIHGIEEGGFIAVMLCKLFRKASIFDMDSCISKQLYYSGFVNNRFLLRFVENLEKWSLRKCSAIITVCGALSDKARSLFHEANIFQIEDIPISSSNQSINGRTEALKKKLDLVNSLRVIYTGNLESYQGIDLLLDSWKILCNLAVDSKDYKLVIVGGNENQIARYKQIAVENGLADSIRWVGQRPSEEMGDWMCLSHVLVSPRSEGDNSPLKIFSYMASGRPIVATRLITHTQVLDDSAAFLADADPVSFGKAILEALKDRKLALQKAERARAVVEQNFSYSVFSKKILDVYAYIT
jgi:glycosyltransferase involved in cell wall biosynthesis